MEAGLHWYSPPDFFGLVLISTGPKSRRSTLTNTLIFLVNMWVSLLSTHRSHLVPWDKAEAQHHAA